MRKFTIIQVSRPFGIPSNLTLIVYSHSQINLSWINNSSGEDGFSIERSDDLGVTYSPVGLVSSGITTFANTGLTGSTVYYYRVRAYKGVDYSIYSNIAHATTYSDRTAGITAWQGSSNDIMISGIPPSYWGSVGSIPEGPALCITPFTVIEKAHAIREKGFIYAFEIYVYYADPPGGQNWEFKLFYWDSSVSEYRCKTSEVFNPAGSGVINNKQKFFLITPMLADEGDIPGFYIPLKCGMYPGNDAYGINIRQTPVPKIVSGNIAVGSSNVFANNAIWSFDPLGVLLYVTCYGMKPYAVFLGDSIFSGGNGTLPGTAWNTDQETSAGYHTPGGSPGDINNAICYRLALRMPGIFRYQNFSASGHTLFMIIQLNSRLARSLYVDPKQVFIHCGINDIYFYGPTPWIAIESYLDTIRTAFPPGTEFYLDAILPVSSCNDSIAGLIRATNLLYSNYCLTHGWNFVNCHDAMGTKRLSTGQYDDLNILYDCGDMLHLNAAGVDKMAKIIRSYIS